MRACMHSHGLAPCVPARAPFQSACAHRGAGTRSGATCRSLRARHACRAAAESQRCSHVPQPHAARDAAQQHVAANRRSMLSAAGAALALAASGPAAAIVEGYTPMTALKGKDYGKSRMSYGDYVTTESGLQYFDLREGEGATPGPGSTCIVDWDGFTIGYYAKVVLLAVQTKGGAFTGEDKEYLRVKLGTGQVIPAFEEALKGMKVGGVRRIIVPEELGYPNGDIDKTGPQPSTFSGLIDKTLLFDIELKRVD